MLNVFKKTKIDVKNSSLSCWYKILEIFLFFFKKTHFDIELLKQGAKIIQEDLTNDNLEKLIKLNYDKNNIIFKKLTKNIECSNNLQFFELYLIDLLKLIPKLRVIDLVYLEDNIYYPNLYKFYTYNTTFNYNEVKPLLNDSYYETYKKGTNIENIGYIDVIIVSHYKYNKQITEYYNDLKKELFRKNPKYKLNFQYIQGINKDDIKELTYNNNKFKLVGCLLRNDNQINKTKTIFGFIQDNKQYIIDETQINLLKEQEWVTDKQFIDNSFEITENSYNFATGEKILIYIKNDCTNIDVIPQYKGTCWFNAILMTTLYSQGSRNILFKEIEINKWGNSDSLTKVLKTILIESYNYKNKTKIQKLYKKIKPETLLLKLTSKHDKPLKQIIKKKQQPDFDDFGWFSYYIVKFLKHLGLKSLDIVYNNDNDIFFVNYLKYINYELKYDIKNNITNNALIINTETIFNHTEDFEIDEIDNILKDDGPDYLLLFHSSLHNNVKEYYKQWVKSKNRLGFAIDNYINDTNINDFKYYKDIINFNSNQYKLDSCLLDNYNDNIGVHAITGITCDDNKYVYNGWNQKTNDNGIKEQIQRISPCSLMPYNWDLHKKEGFCLNTKDCKLDFHNLKEKKEDLCFSFNHGNRILIYTKILDKKYETSKFPITSSKTNSISHLSSIINNVYNLKDYTREQLINNLLLFNHNKIILERYTDDEQLRELLNEEIDKYYNVKQRLPPLILKEPIEISLDPNTIHIKV